MCGWASVYKCARACMCVFVPCGGGRGYKRKELGGRTIVCILFLRSTQHLAVNSENTQS